MTAISALVCSRNRGAAVVDTIASILSNTHPDFELIFIDQSTNDDSEIAARAYLSDPRLKYVRSSAKGKGHALNLGLTETSGPIIAITDDDCTVPSNWLEMFEAIFARRDNVAVAYCNVAEGAHDTTAGFIPAYVAASDKILRTVIDLCGSRSIGAGTAVRRSMIEKLGGFDFLLGPGERFPGADDFDIKYRAVLAGYEVYDSAAFAVVHFGFRTWQQGREYARLNYLGVGAACAKPLKCGRLTFAVVPLFELVRHCLFPPLWDLLRLRKPQGVTRVTAFITGFIRGCGAPVDSASMLFIDTKPTEDRIRYASAT